jgi:hypothetical protein
MQREAQYGVKFVGYSAYVIARGKYGREVEYATLDFVSGAASMHADGGWVLVHKRIDLEPFLKSLPEIANELRDRCHCDGELSQQTDGLAGPTGTADKMIRLSCGQNTISVAPCTKITKFIRQVTQRFTEVEQVLEQAEEIGLQIKRRPYSEYIDEIAETGLSRVEGFGSALFIDGKLIFQPDYQVLLVRPVGTRGDTLEVHPLTPTSKIDTQSIH